MKREVKFSEMIQKIAENNSIKKILVAKVTTFLLCSPLRL